MFWPLLILGAVLTFVGHLLVVVDAWQKGILWGLGCLLCIRCSDLCGFELENRENSVPFPSGRIYSADLGGEYAGIRRSFSRIKRRSRSRAFFAMRFNLFYGCS